MRVVVVRGAGRAFCSGIDITALSQGETGMTFFPKWEAALRKLETLDASSIKAIHSHCIGGGLHTGCPGLRPARRARRCTVRDHGRERGHHSWHRHVASREARRGRPCQTARAGRRHRRRSRGEGVGPRGLGGGCPTGSRPRLRNSPIESCPWVGRPHG